MLRFFKSFFGKNKPSVQKIYVAPKTPENINVINEISTLKYPLEENILNDFDELIAENNYHELAKKIDEIKDDSITFNEDFGSLIISLSSKGDEIKDELAINSARKLINKVDKDFVEEKKYFDLLWGIANNRTGETTSAIFQIAFDELFKNDYKQSDFDNLNKNIKGMSKGSPETFDLDNLPDKTKVKIECDLKILEIIEQKFKEKEQKISNSPSSSPSISEYTQTYEKSVQLG